MGASTLGGSSADADAGGAAGAATAAAAAVTECRFDFIICALLITTTLMRFGSQVAPFRLIRLLRAVRLLRTVRLFPNLAIVVETTVKASSSVVYIFMFGMLFSYMFAIVGVASFGRNDPFYFGDLGNCRLPNSELTCCT